MLIVASLCSRLVSYNYNDDRRQYVRLRTFNQNSKAAYELYDISTPLARGARDARSSLQIATQVCTESHNNNATRRYVCVRKRNEFVLCSFTGFVPAYTAQHIRYGNGTVARDRWPRSIVVVARRLFDCLPADDVTRKYSFAARRSRKRGARWE